MSAVDILLFKLHCVQWRTFYKQRVTFRMFQGFDFEIDVKLWPFDSIRTCHSDLSTLLTRASRSQGTRLYDIK